MGKELRDWYFQHGICVACGQADAAPHRKLCWECLDNKRERTCKYRANMTEEQKQAARKKACERSKKQYAERKAAGKCTRCGKKPAEPGKVMCTMCRKKDAKRQMEKRRENGALPRYMFGDGYHCVICGKDVDNTGDGFVQPWLDAVKLIRPMEVMIYTIDRETPAHGLLKATHEELNSIRDRVAAEGIACTASY